MMDATLMSVLASGTDWSISKLLSNSGTTLQNWGALILVVLGAAAMIIAAVMIVRGLASKQSQTSWGKVILLFVVGGIFLFGGWGVWSSLGAGANTTVKTLGSGNAEDGATNDIRNPNKMSFAMAGDSMGEHIAILPDGSTIEF